MQDEHLTFLKDSVALDFLLVVTVHLNISCPLLGALPQVPHAPPVLLHPKLQGL